MPKLLFGTASSSALLSTTASDITGGGGILCSLRERCMHKERKRCLYQVAICGADDIGPVQ